ncbi:MAG: efflux transporter periplasmic adaptor subunit [Gallionellaceae bacterium CG1_02_56_997]|nr:MAG: efflux transporter periplasmic adaptor subunit [Gallionellaceae bacterium CG1_02_56_997]
MRSVSLIFSLVVLSATPSCYANEDILVSAKQVTALGITTVSLPSARTGEMSGLPAQVVIPANQLHIISTPLPAIVEQTLVGVGDNVKKGQVIARLQSPALAEAQRGLLQSAVQHQLARENLARDAALFKDGIISESRYRASKGSVLETRAVLSEHQQMLRFSGMTDGAITKLQAGNNLSSMLTLTSPIDGVVLEKSASAGQRVEAAVPVFKIGKLSPLALEIQAPLAYASRLSIGASISIPAYNANGKITAIGRSLSVTNQTLLLRGTAQQGAENLRPGQFVEVSITTGTNNPVQWEIPNSAISHIAGKVVVFTKSANGFHSLPISIINQGTQNSLVSGTFKGDEKIAVSGVSALKASMMGIGGGE